MNNTQFPNYFKYVVSIIISLFLIWSPVPVFAAVQIIADSEANPATVKEIQETVDVFSSVIQADFNVSPDIDVRIFVCSNRESMLSVLEQELPTSKNKIAASNFIYATTQFSSHTIFVDESNTEKKAAYERAETIAKYLSRHLWLQLNAYTIPDDIKVETQGSLNYLYWLDEGISDFIGGLVAEKRGLRSMEKWERERVLWLRGTLKPMTYNEAQILHVGSWANFLSPGAPYKADLLTVYLLETVGKDNILKAIPNYYRLSAGTNNIYEAWTAAFGLNYDELLKGFVPWYNKKVFLIENT